MHFPYMVSQNDWTRAAGWYSSQLQEFAFEHKTPALMEVMRRKTSHLQKVQVSRESHNVWKIPLFLAFNKATGEMGVLPNLPRSAVGIEGIAHDTNWNALGYELVAV